MRLRHSRRKFQSTLPVWGATATTPCTPSFWMCFNPRSPCGERRETLHETHETVIVSIHAPRVGSDKQPDLLELSEIVSIHAPRVGSDRKEVPLCLTTSRFNPRSPCGERRHTKMSTDYSGCFNPRSPCGERRTYRTFCEVAAGVSIHAPRVGSDAGEQFGIAAMYVSIHAPRVGSDCCGATIMYRAVVFQSTLPVWGATVKVRMALQVTPVSIHAPRVGSDEKALPRRRYGKCFNPRSPCGERRASGTPGSTDQSFNPRSPCGERQDHMPLGYAQRCFNPRSPCGERPAFVPHGCCGDRVSIHAPRVGSDNQRVVVIAPLDRFQSTLPVWGATMYPSLSAPYGLFQSTLPVWGATALARSLRMVALFQSTLPVWGATSIRIPPHPSRSAFQSTLPVWGAT